MPNAYLDARDRWLDLSDIDYLGHFVRAWLAFNAWYRGAYTHTQDRQIVDEIKWQPNAVRNGVLPLLTAQTADGADFRANVGLLHERLEGHRLEVGKAGNRAQITFRNVFIKTQQVAVRRDRFSGMIFEVRPGAQGGSVESEVTARGGQRRFFLQQHRYDLPQLEGNVDFLRALNANQQGRLRGLYIAYSPRVFGDLTNLPGNGARQIGVGAVNMNCAPEDLFAGVIENVYQMRCALFHGELVPTKEATGCYEPAYRIVRRCLASIN